MRAETFAELPPEATGLPAPLSVSGAMSLTRINLNLTGASKDAVLRELASMVIGPRRKRDLEILFKALKAREKLCSTCVNEGVAIPHSRNALVGLVKRPVIAYGRHAGLDFGAPDGQPVRHFFLLCAPNVRQHLQLLGRLARLAQDPAFRRQLEAAQKPEDVLDFVRIRES